MRRRTTSAVAALLCSVALLHGAELPPLNSNNALNVSWGDQIVLGKGSARLDSPEHIRQALERWQSLGRIRVVYWRISSWLIQNYHVHRQTGFEWYYGALSEIEKVCDPRAEALKAAKACGMQIYAYMTVYDEGAPADVLYGDNSPFPWQSTFTVEHPEYLVCDRSGKARHAGVMEYLCPEVRKYKIGQALAFLDAYDYDGIYICTRSHSPPAESADLYGFNAPVVAAYAARHGANILESKPDLVKWRDLRGEGLTLFLCELSEELRRRGKRLAVGVPRLDSIGPPYGNMTLHWREWVKERIIDELVVGVQSGNFHYPSQRGKDRERGYLASPDEGWGLAPFQADIQEKYGPLCHRNHVVLRSIGGSVFAVPPLDGHMIGAATFGSHILRVSVADHAALDLGTAAASVELMVNPASLSGFPRLVSKYDHSLGDQGRGWEIMVGEEGKVVFRLDAPGIGRHYTSDAALLKGKWNHVACGFDSARSVVEITVNGVVKTFADAAAIPPRPVPVPLCLGRYAGGGRPLAGALAQIRFWDRLAAFDGKGAAVVAGAAQTDLTVSEDGIRFAGKTDGVACIGDLKAAVVPGPGSDTKAIQFAAPE